ncbi:MAG: amino acid racemase [Clostridia bacterium]|nr:amino acid racemase [Clostridia bacterium]
MKKTIGIIGGMGPLATADLFRKIVLLADVSSDQGHPRVLIDSNTEIPDRTAAILSGGENPIPALATSARTLERAGADVLMMPCNTAHFFYDGVKAATSLPILHMLQLTAEEIDRRGIKTVGLLATDGTINTGIYEKLFEEHGVKVIKPDAEHQKLVMGVIYDGVKAGNMDFDTAPFCALLDSMLEEGVESFVLGCTELPIAFDDYKLPYPVVDPTRVLAEAALKFAGVKVKE